MTRTPQVSVVMSVYDGGDALRGSVQSILSQAGVDFELIVVNDGSTDTSAGVLDEFARADRRVQVIHQENQGLTRALIRGCAAARGEFIARQDVGDWSMESRLESQCATLDGRSDLSFASCWTEVCGPREEFLRIEKGSGSATSPIDIISARGTDGLIDGPSHHGSVMFRREHYQRAGGYRPQFYFGQDWDLWYRLAELGKFQMVQRVLYRARVTPHSLSGKYRDAQNAIGKLSRQASLRRGLGQKEDDLLIQAEAIRPGSRSSDPTRTIADGLYWIGEQLRRNGDDRAEDYLRRSIAIAPSDLRSWVRLMQFRASKVFRRAETG